MKEHKQLFRHRPDEGQIGDCWRTCIACLLDLDPEQVPHFCADCWDDSKTATANAKAYLATRGLSFVEYAMDGDLEDILRAVAACNPGLHYLLCGKSRTGVNHQVICCDDRIVWDPSQTDAGIVGPADDGYYWITWLVPLSLARGERLAA